MHVYMIQHYKTDEIDGWDEPYIVGIGSTSDKARAMADEYAERMENVTIQWQIITVPETHKTYAQAVINDKSVIFIAEIAVDEHITQFARSSNN